VQRLSRRGEVVGCGGGWRGEEGRSSSGREGGGARGSRRGEAAGAHRQRGCGRLRHPCRGASRGEGQREGDVEEEEGPGWTTREREGGTHHSARQPGGSGGWGMAWDAIVRCLVREDEDEEDDEPLPLSSSSLVCDGSLLSLISRPMLAARASTGLRTQTCAACTNPHKRRCLSTSPAPPTTTRPPTRRRILFFGADAFSCHVFTQLHSARAGPSLRPSPPPSVAVADLPPSAATDLVDSLTVVVPPDQRTGRRLKHVHRRALLPPPERETHPRPMS